MVTVEKYSYVDGTKKIIESVVTTEAQDSVELSVDAKGNVKPSVKCYDKDINEASKRAQETLDVLLAKYQNDKV